MTWNSTEFIREALRSIKEQTVSPVKVIVIDNASHDAIDLKKIMFSEFSSYELILLDKNIGFAAANNIGISCCNDLDFIALLNPDAFPDTTWLQCLINAIQKYPDYSFFSSRQMQLGEGVLDGAGDEMFFFGKPYRRGYGRKISAKYLIDRPVFSACAAAAIYQRAVLVEVGGFDEDFFCYIEDVDLSFRLQLLGYKCMYVADAVVTHIGSASLGKRSDFAMYYGQRNMVICFFKDMPLPLLLAFTPFHILCNAFYMFVALFFGKFKVVFSAKCSAFSKIKKIVEKRHVVQSTKKISTLKLLRLFSFGMFNN